MTKIHILYPDVAKESAAALAEVMGATCENPYETKNRNFQGYDIVLKYGFSRPVKVTKGTTVLNKSESIKLSRDKILTFKLFQEDGFMVPFTTDKKTAIKWLATDVVVSRSVTNGSNGHGLKYCYTKKDIPDNAVFFTKYIDHKNEYRINCWRDQIMTVYDKVVPNEHFRFKILKGNNYTKQLRDLVAKVHEKTGLDIYGLDVVVSEHDGKVHLLEINSSPVLFPTTIKAIDKKIKEEIINAAN